MTPEELDKLEVLWKRGDSIADIAKQMSYAECTISRNMSKDRVRFPKRYCLARNRQRVDQYVYRILSGRMKVKEVALVFGVREQSVRNWIKEYSDAKA